MTIFCHRCQRAVDLPADGEFSSIMTADYTTAATYQCLDADCWNGLLTEIGDNLDELGKHVRLMELSNKTAEERHARLREGGAPRDTTEAARLMQTRRAQLGPFQAQARRENEAQAAGRDGGDARPQRREDEARERAAPPPRRPRRRPRHHRGDEDHDDQDIQVGAPDEVYGFNNRVAADNLEVLAPVLRDVAADGMPQRPRRPGRNRERARARSGDRELVRMMMELELPGVQYDERGRPFYELIDVDDGDQLPIMYTRPL